MWAPALHTEHNIVLSPESRTWSGSLSRVSTFNSIIYLTATVCSTSSGQFHVTLESYATDSTLESIKLQDKLIYKRFSCEEVSLFNVLVTEQKYMLSIETIDIDSFTFTLGYINSDYTDFIIKLKVVMMQVLVLTSLIFILRLGQIHYSQWDNLSKFTLLQSIACIMYVFPFEILAVIWNFTIWQVLNNVSRAFFVAIMIGYPKYSQSTAVDYRLVTYAGTVVAFVAGNVFEVINVYVSIVALAVLVGFLVIVYREKIQRLFIDSSGQRIYTCVELFIMVLLLLGTQCGVFILFPVYSELESLSVINLCAYTIFIQCANSVTGESISNYFAEALKPIIIESELIKINVS